MDTFVVILTLQFTSSASPVFFDVFGPFHVAVPASSEPYLEIRSLVCLWTCCLTFEVTFCWKLTFCRPRCCYFTLCSPYFQSWMPAPQWPKQRLCEETGFKSLCPDFLSLICKRRALWPWMWTNFVVMMCKPERWSSYGTRFAVHFFLEFSERNVQLLGVS